ncbi:Flowering-promoting factor 1-like protein 1 [Senna tora]|uniref:Flowering-promoting factor 1-like protein 1 n=1 Tax=Senna tora TaxID=362788 RepID=A0A834TLX7_9FABA|nr:Flowering-promoting factor 1-like protein 1 [Senna tora]
MKYFSDLEYSRILRKFITVKVHLVLANLPPGLTYLEEARVVKDNLVEMEVLEVVEVGREGNEVRGGVGAMELNELRRVVVPSPPELDEAVLQLVEGPNHVIGREVDEHPRSCAGGRGGAGAGERRRVLLEGFSGWVAD